MPRATFSGPASSGTIVKAADTPENRQLAADCLRQVAYRALSTNTRSWYLSDALRSKARPRSSTSVPAIPAAVDSNLSDYVNYYRVRVNADRSADTDKLLGLQFDDGRAYGLHVRRSLVDFVPDLSGVERAPDVAVSLTPETWTLVFNNLADPAALIDAGEISVVQGDAADAKALFGMFDPVYDLRQNDPALKALGEMLQAGATADAP